MKKRMIVVVFAMALCGCGLMSSKGMPKEQLDSDIEKQTVKVQEGGTEWSFSGDSQRCFAVVDEESKYEASNAEVMVNVASWRDISIGDSALYRAVFGKILLSYKNAGGKWELEKAEPKDLIEKTLEFEEFKKFVDIQTPLCKFSRFVR